MDVNDNNQDLDDTIDSIDDVGVANVGDNGVKTIENDANADNNSVGSAVEVPDNPVFSKPLTRDSSGRFTKGTGSRGHLGGRPVGARDKITTTMIRLAEQTAAEHGEQMFRKLAQTDPAACLALITRLLPSSDLSEAIKNEAEDKEAIQQITISLVGKPTEQRIEPPKPRLERASDDDIAQAIPQHQPDDIVAETTPEARPETPSEPSQAERDAEAEEAEKARVARQNETIKQYGGLTGVPSRAQRKGNGIDYPDDYNI